MLKQSMGLQADSKPFGIGICEKIKRGRNIPTHRDRKKYKGSGQVWFSESRTNKDIRRAGEYVAIAVPGNCDFMSGNHEFKIFIDE